MPDYKLGKIYKIVNSVNDAVYLGSTCQTLSMRMAAHRSQAKIRPVGALHRAMIELGVDKFRIILVEEYPCANKSLLEAREFQITSEMKAAGVELYNLLIDGKHSEESRQKMSEAHIGKTFSEETRQKIRMANFKRGCICFKQKRARWCFQWHEDGKRKAKYFSISKYGNDAAHGLALAFRDSFYPEEPEDDSEFIRELQARIN